MDATHRRYHLQDLSGRRYFLRTLTPDTVRYKLWLGDLVEFVNAAYGPESAEIGQVRAILARYPRLPGDARKEERERQYLERLEALGVWLEQLDAGAAEPGREADGR